jgi:hypothetical protein
MTNQDGRGRPLFLLSKVHDSGTSITCLTPSAWPASILQAKWDISRCYFQANGMLRDVWYNGSDWIIAGNVPISAIQNGSLSHMLLLPSSASKLAFDFYESADPAILIKPLSLS